MKYKVGDKLVCRENFGDCMDTIIWYKKHNSYEINDIRNNWFEENKTAYFISINDSSDLEFEYSELLKHFYIPSELRRKKLDIINEISE